MIVISASDFRSKTGYYLSKALTQEVVVRSRDAGSFKLVPVEENDGLISQKDYDEYFTPEMIEEISQSEQQIRTGKSHAMRHEESLSDFLNRVKDGI